MWAHIFIPHAPSMGTSHVDPAHLEDVLQALHSHCDDAGVVDGQQLAQGFDAAHLHQEADLVSSAARGGVADRPGSLLLDVELSSGQKADQRGQQVGVDHGLDLVLWWPSAHSTVASVGCLWTGFEL